MAASGNRLPAHKNAYNELDWEIMAAKLEAEWLCRKIHAGCTPWTPPLTQAIQRVLYWKGIAKQLTGGTISTTVLKRRVMKVMKGQVSFNTAHWHLMAAEVKGKVSVAYDNHYQIKAQSNKRDTWLSQVITAQAKVKNIPKQ